MNEQNQLAVQPEQEPANILQVIARAAQDHSIDVAKMERLLSMAERMEKRQAEKDFAAALTALQGETVRVVATKKVDEKADGTCRYKFAPYETIMEAVQPLLIKHNFSITFDTETDDKRLTSICTLTHSAGHSRSNKFAVRYGKPPGSSDAQGDMSTKSYAKRGALCDALNISIEHDDDARAEGGLITQEQADELRRLAKATNTSEAKFLAHAQAETFEQIREGRFADLAEVLRRREAKASKPEKEQNETLL